MMARRQVALLACGSFNPPTYLHLRLFERAKDFLQNSKGFEVLEGIISPASDAYGKPELLSAQHRVKMVELATQSSSWLRVDDWESKQNQWSRSLTVLRHFRSEIRNKYGPIERRKRGTGTDTEASTSRNTARNANDFNGEQTHDDAGSMPSPGSLGPTLLFVCGADLLESFAVPDLWKLEDIEEIIRDFGLVVISRSGSDPQKFIYQSDLLTKYQRNIHLVTEWISNEISSTAIRRALRRRESIKYLVPDPVIEYIESQQLYALPSPSKKASIGGVSGIGEPIAKRPRNVKTFSGLCPDPGLEACVIEHSHSPSPFPVCPVAHYLRPPSPYQSSSQQPTHAQPYQSSSQQPPLAQPERFDTFQSSGYDNVPVRIVPPIVPPKRDPPPYRPRPRSVDTGRIYVNIPGTSSPLSPPAVRSVPVSIVPSSQLRADSQEQEEPDSVISSSEDSRNVPASGFGSEVRKNGHSVAVPRSVSVGSHIRTALEVKEEVPKVVKDPPMSGVMRRRNPMCPKHSSPGPTKSVAFSDTEEAIVSTRDKGKPLAAPPCWEYDPEVTKSLPNLLAAEGSSSGPSSNPSLNSLVFRIKEFKISPTPETTV